MGDHERPVRVDLASVFRAHHTGVDIESIDLTAATVAAVPVAVSAVAGVKSGCDGVLVSLHCVILRAPDVVAQVSITVVVAVTGIVARHVDEVCSSIAVATNVAEIQSVGKVLVHQIGLPIHVWVPSVISTVAKVKS